MKFCKCCSKSLDLSKFYNNKRSPDWKSFYCKECLNKKTKSRFNNNKDKWNEYQRSYFNNRIPQQLQQHQHPQQQTIEPKESFKEKFNAVTLEALCQSAYKEAYEEIMSDEDAKRFFENKRSEETKIQELEKRQDKINKIKEKQVYAEKRKKMRELVDATLEWKDKKEFEDTLMDFWEGLLEEYIWTLSRLTTISFKVSWRSIYEIFLEKKQNWNAMISLS